MYAIVCIYIYSRCVYISIYIDLYSTIIYLYIPIRLRWCWNIFTNMTALVLKITQFCRFLYTSTMEPGRLSDLVLEGSSRAGARVCQGATSGPGKIPNFYEFLWISMDFYECLWISMKSRESIGKSESDLPLNPLLWNLLGFIWCGFDDLFILLSERRKVVGVVQVRYPWSWHLGH